MATQKTRIKQEQGKEPMPVEVLAESIRSISQGIKKLQEGPLNDKCLYLLIQNAAPSTGRNYQKISIAEIKAVLNGIESLASTYLKKKKPV